MVDVIVCVVHVSLSLRSRSVPARNFSDEYEGVRSALQPVCGALPVVRAMGKERRLADACADRPASALCAADHVQLGLRGLKLNKIPPPFSKT